MTTKIHHTAQVADGAEIGEGVIIGPSAVIGPHVKIGNGTRIGPLSVVDGHTTIGEENVIVGQASLGGAPQDLSYRGEPTRLEIGDRNTIREFVSINLGTVKGGGVTRIGSDNLIMACCHVAHDCELGDHIVLSNGSGLAGHVKIGRNANLSGMCGVVHFVTVGEFSFLAGMTRQALDVPPYMIVEGHEGRVRGVNMVGLQRGGVPKADQDALRQAHRRLFRGTTARGAVLEEMRGEEIESSYVQNLVASMTARENAVRGRAREVRREDFEVEGRALMKRMGVPGYVD
ncbi:MAG: UDP-N-acetylglucosamine acyltransferase [Planctomycetota bacterium]|jgi:UDP-N-acetylglucosamine acyltransferase